MRSKSTAVAVAAVLTLAVPALLVGPGAADVATDAAAASNETTTVSVSGTGEAVAEPDRALLSLSVTARGDTSAEATDRLAENVSTLRSTLDGAPAVETVRTVDFRVSEVRGNGTTRFVARQAFEATVTDVDAVGDVIDAAVGTRPTAVDGVAFELSAERERSVRATAIDRAVADADADATAVANSTGLALDGLRSVSVDGGGGGVFLEDRSAGTVIDPGPVTVRVTVRATYDATADGT
jgi:uncharacterized protein YggE